MRNKLVEIIASKDIKDKKVLDAIRAVPRHLFMDSSFEDHAYQDKALPIAAEQTISQPYTVAFQTELLELNPGDKILEIGTGSGYQAAVLAEIVRDVYTIEIIPELAKQAEKKFKDLNYQNIHTRIGDGYHGWPEEAPFDAIVVTAAPDEIPTPLIEQLKEGGKLVILVGPKYSVQSLQLVTKKKGKASITNLFPVRFVPFTRD